MGLIKRALAVLLAPWRLSAQLEGYHSTQTAFLADLMGVQRIQAETNARMAIFLEQMTKAMEVDGAPEGRTGLSDEEELQLLARLERADLPPKWGSES